LGTGYLAPYSIIEEARSLQKGKAMKTIPVGAIVNVAYALHTLYHAITGKNCILEVGGKKDEKKS